MAIQTRAPVTHYQTTAGKNTLCERISGDDGGPAVSRLLDDGLGWRVEGADDPALADRRLRHAAKCRAVVASWAFRVVRRAGASAQYRRPVRLGDFG
jgi:hypothetical protein